MTQEPPSTNAYFQEIIARYPEKTPGLSYEVLFRPSQLGTSTIEDFYQQLAESALLSLTLTQLHQLAETDYSQMDIVSPTCHHIARLFVNIEARVLPLVEAELIWLNDTLRLQHDIELVIEITERVPPEQVQAVFRSVAYLHDVGLKIALDDFEPNYDLRAPWLKTGCIAYIKLILPPNFENDAQVRLSFIEHIYQLKDISTCNVIVEKVETLEQFWLMEQVPYDGLQGYLFSRPKRLAEP
ncbi:EAL domain-containing protein [Shewanella algae]|uniref:EAL domain-containing protein n=1 Tax=Shewanella algae TaxID=38313 RepID=UPI0031F5A391